MERIILPPPLNQRETQKISIDNINTDLTYIYNERENSWYFNFSTPNGFNLEFQRLAQGINIGRMYQGFPFDGNFIIYSDSGDKDDPTLENFGQSVFLAYEK